MTPVIKAFKNNFPGSKITYVANHWVKDLIKYLPDVDEEMIIDITGNENIFGKIYKGFKLIPYLRKQKFDMVFLGHRNNFLGILLKLAGIKYRLGFRNTKFTNISAKFDGTISETNRYLKILRDNGFAVNSAQTHLKRISDKKSVKKLLNINEQDFVIGIFPFGGINPGTEMDIKRWEMEKYLKLIEQLSSVFKDFKIIVFEGLTHEEEFNYDFKNRNVIKDRISIEKIQICDIFICGDTGPLHIAAAFNIPTVAVFGPSDPELVAPEYLNKETGVTHKTIRKNIECSPCYTTSTAIDRKNKKYWRNSSFICYTGHHKCIKEITVEEVLNSTVEIINQIKTE